MSRQKPSFLILDLICYGIINKAMGFYVKILIGWPQRTLGNPPPKKYPQGLAIMCHEGTVSMSSQILCKHIIQLRTEISVLENGSPDR